jgi:hypothetical protein
MLLDRGIINNRSVRGKRQSDLVISSALLFVGSGRTSEIWRYSLMTFLVKEVVLTVSSPLGFFLTLPGPALYA